MEYSINYHWSCSVQWNPAGRNPRKCYYSWYTSIFKQFSSSTCFIFDHRINRWRFTRGGLFVSKYNEFCSWHRNPDWPEVLSVEIFQLIRLGNRSFEVFHQSLNRWRYSFRWLFDWTVLDFIPYVWISRSQKCKSLSNTVILSIFILIIL